MIDRAPESCGDTLGQSRDRPELSRGICHPVELCCVYIGLHNLGLPRLERNPGFCRLNLDMGHHIVKQGMLCPCWFCAGCEFDSLQQTI